MYDYLSYILFLIGFILLALFFYSLFKQRNRLAPLFSLMCLSMVIYIIGYGFELISTNLEQIKFFLKVEYFGFALLPAYWILLSYKFHFNRYSSFGLTMMILIIPVLTLIITATNEYHHLYYANIVIIEHDNYFSAELTKGPWYYVFTGYSYLSLLFGLTLFYKSWKQSSYDLRTQSFWMLFGSIWPGIASVLYLIRVVPYELDLTTFGFLMLAIAYFIAIFKFDFLELKEIVRGHAFSQINEGIIVIDTRGRIIDYNNTGQETFDWLNPRNIGKSLHFFAEGRVIGENAKDSFEIEIERKGQKKYYGFRGSDLKEKNKTVGNIFIFQDITEQKKVMEKLNHFATHDTLTGIYNRRKLMEEAEKELYRIERYGGDVSVLMLDIDFFKNVNDQYGHLAGDMVIQRVAQACKTRLRSIDIIGRYGGEEFAIVLPETNKESARIIAEQIRERIAEMVVDYNGKCISITISIGISSISGGERQITMQELINEADMALYSAKNNGRNQAVVF